MNEKIEGFYLELVGAREVLELAPKESIRPHLRDEVARDLLESEIFALKEAWAKWVAQATRGGVDVYPALAKRAVVENNIHQLILKESATGFFTEIAHLRGNLESRLQHIRLDLRMLGITHAGRVSRAFGLYLAAEEAGYDADIFREAKRALAERRMEVAQHQDWLRDLEFAPDDGIRVAYESSLDNELDRLNTEERPWQ